MKKIKCIKEYQMVGCQIPIGTILSEIDSKIGNTSYKDKKGIIYNFDNSEILFSPIFQKSFINFKEKHMISKNVMKTDEFNDSIFYRAACSCGSNEHDITIEFEIDKEIPSMLFLNFYKNIAWCPSWSNLNLFQRIGSRIACSLKMLFTGYIESHESFIIQGEDDINSFIEALEEGKLYITTKGK